MNKLLILKHYQIFVILILYCSIIAVILNLTQIQTTRVVDILLFNVIPIFGYPLLLTHSLDKFFKLSKARYLLRLKSFDIFWMLYVIPILISESLLDEEERVGLKAISNYEQIGRFILGIISLYFLWKYYKAPSKALKSFELRREAGPWEYVADAFQIFAWPLCIWWIQPRFNKLYQKLSNSQSIP